MALRIPVKNPEFDDEGRLINTPQQKTGNVIGVSPFGGEGARSIPHRQPTIPPDFELPEEETHRTYRAVGPQQETPVHPRKAGSIIPKFREEYPEYNEFPDDVVLGAVYNKMYSDYPYEEFEQKFLDKYGAPDPGLLRTFGRGFVSGWLNLGAAVEGLYRWTTGEEIPTKFGEWVQEAQQNFAPPRSVQQSIRDNPWVLSNPKWWLYHGPSLIPYIAVSVAAGGVGGVAAGAAARGLSLGRRGAWAAQSAGAGYSVGAAHGVLEGGRIYVEALESGMSQEDASERAADTMKKNFWWVGTTSVAQAGLIFGLGGGLTSAGTAAATSQKVFQGLSRRTVYPISTAVESFQEAGQEIIANLALDRPWHENLEEAMVLGAFGGLAFTGGMDLVQSRYGYGRFDKDAQEVADIIKTELEKQQETPTQVTPTPESIQANVRSVFEKIAPEGTDLTTLSDEARARLEALENIPTENIEQVQTYLQEVVEQGIFTQEEASAILQSPPQVVPEGLSDYAKNIFNEYSKRVDPAQVQEDMSAFDTILQQNPSLRKVIDSIVEQNQFSPEESRNFTAAYLAELYLAGKDYETVLNNWNRTAQDMIRSYRFGEDKVNEVVKGMELPAVRKRILDQIQDADPEKRQDLDNRGADDTEIARTAVEMDIPAVREVADETVTETRKTKNEEVRKSRLMAIALNLKKGNLNRETIKGIFGLKENINLRSKGRKIGSIGPDDVPNRHLSPDEAIALSDALNRLGYETEIFHRVDPELGDQSEVIYFRTRGEDVNRAIDIRRREFERKPVTPDEVRDLGRLYGIKEKDIEKFIEDSGLAIQKPERPSFKVDDTVPKMMVGTIDKNISGLVESILDKLGIDVKLAIINFNDVQTDSQIDNFLKKYNLPEKERRLFKEMIRRASDNLGSEDVALSIQDDYGRSLILTKDTFRGRQLSKSEYLGTTLHELGHVITSHLWRNTDRSVKKSLFDAHKVWYESVKGVALRDVVIGIRNPLLSDFFSDLPSRGMTKAEMDYFLSFNEWMADNVSKWIIESEKPRTVVDRFFKRLADALRLVYDRYKGITKTDETVHQWLDNHWRGVEERVQRRVKQGEPAPQIKVGDKPTKENLTPGTEWRLPATRKPPAKSNVRLDEIASELEIVADPETRKQLMEERDGILAEMQEFTEPVKGKYNYYEVLNVSDTHVQVRVTDRSYNNDSIGEEFNIPIDQFVGEESQYTYAPRRRRERTPAEERVAEDIRSEPAKEQLSQDDFAKITQGDVIKVRVTDDIIKAVRDFKWFDVVDGKLRKGNTIKIQLTEDLEGLRSFERATGIRVTPDEGRAETYEDVGVQVRNTQDQNVKDDARMAQIESELAKMIDDGRAKTPEFQKLHDELRKILLRTGEKLPDQYARWIWEHDGRKPPEIYSLKVYQDVQEAFGIPESEIGYMSPVDLRLTVNKMTGDIDRLAFSLLPDGMSKEANSRVESLGRKSAKKIGFDIEGTIKEMGLTGDDAKRMGVKLAQMVAMPQVLARMNPEGFGRVHQAVVRGVAHLNEILNKAITGNKQYADFKKKPKAYSTPVFKALVDGTLHKRLTSRIAKESDIFPDESRGTRTYEYGKIWSDQELRSKYNLNDQQIADYHMIRKMVNDGTDRMVQTAIIAGMDPAKAKELFSLQGYFPMDRGRGKWVITYRDDTSPKKDDQTGFGYGFTRFESHKKAKEYATQMAEDGKIPVRRDKDGNIIRDAEGNPEFVGMFGLKKITDLPQQWYRSVPTVQDLVRLVESSDLDVTNLTDDAKAILDAARKGNYIEARRMRRGNVPTIVDPDNMFDALEDFIDKTARRYSRVWSKTEIDAEMTALLKNPDGSRADPTWWNYTNKYVDHAFSPDPITQSRWNQIRKATFMFHLGWNLSNGLLNLNQTFLTLAPMLNEKTWGLTGTQALQHFGRAHRVASKWVFGDGSLPDNVAKRFPGLQEALMENTDDGTMAPNLTEQQQGVERNPNIINLFGRRINLREVDRVIGVVQSVTERYNRTVSVVAGYTAAQDIAKNAKGNRNLSVELARIMGLERHSRDDAEIISMEDINALPVEKRRQAYEDATSELSRKIMEGRLDSAEQQRLASNFGKYSSNTTQFIFGKHNVPKYLWGEHIAANPMRAAFIFRGFLFNYVGFWANSLKQGRISPRSFTMLMLPLVALAGLSGLPFAEDLKDALRGAGIADVDAEIRNLLNNEWLSDLMLKGVPAALPSSVAFDFSRRAGIGQVLPRGSASALGNMMHMPLRQLHLVRMNPELGREFSGNMMNAMKDFFGGAPLSMFQDGMFEGTNDLLMGNYTDGMQRIMPIAARNVIKAVRYGTEGSVSPGGRMRVAAEDLSPPHIVERALGFEPLKVAKAMDFEASYRYSVYGRRNIVSHFNDMIAKAAVSGRQRDMQRAIEDVMSYNSRVSPEDMYNISIQMPAIRRRFMLLTIPEVDVQLAPEQLRPELMERREQFTGR